MLTYKKLTTLTAYDLKNSNFTLGFAVVNDLVLGGTIPFNEMNKTRNVLLQNFFYKSDMAIFSTINFEENPYFFVESTLRS